MNNEIIELEKEILFMKKSLLGICENEENFFNLVSQINDKMQMFTNCLEQLDRCIGNIKYEVLDPRIEKESIFYPQILEVKAAIEKITQEKKSMARFGDGEFSIMGNIYRWKFQKLDERLVKRLEEVILSDDDRILIGIADNYGDLTKYNKRAADGIREYMTEDTRKSHMKYLRRDKVYYDAYISRPYASYNDGKEGAEKRFEDLRRIWEKRDVIIVEGALTRFGVGNDLLDNAGRIRRILGPATSSFDRYDEILESALSYGEEDVLYLIAMGPSAGVLAYDLTQEGYQAVDMGHIDLEYEWFLTGEGRSVVKNKYNNEIPNGDIVEDIDLPLSYFEQIIAEIK